MEAALTRKKEEAIDVNASGSPSQKKKTQADLACARRWGHGPPFGVVDPRKRQELIRRCHVVGAGEGACKPRPSEYLRGE
jgi:hypothetical protein